MRDHEYWRDKLQLTKHPEGGHYREIYRADEFIAVRRPESEAAQRNQCTSIYFLLKSGERNFLHRIKSDELWHFYDGSPLIVYEIDAQGNLRKNLLGLNPDNGELPLLVIKAGSWFCAEVLAENSFTLAGCTVSPGFDFKDLEIADRGILMEEFPQHGNFINKFTAG